ncbi:hypothetical protein OEB99_19475 [Actinotalea sp. M2MS4P-6]|uniref:serpin family protein n=1 Tax=Actinotalea sp. M2MS4P-6 TaxID=2983762 RepID=UPI0021E4DF26|nr:serpin family protein [Actinotalea sp. M2MS4P-6]MCV2396497.1 hypothetical protein [Actinotalea sp. M2MS4P-6]
MVGSAMVGRARVPGALAALVAITGLVTLAGCGQAAEAVQHTGQVRSVPPGQLDAGDVADAQTAFGLDLVHALCSEPAGSQDVLVSPTALAEVLGMLQPAARGGTATALADLLHEPLWSDDLVAAQREHTTALTSLSSTEEGRDTLEMSNRLWTALGVAPEQEYLDDVATAFDASVWEVDLAGDPDGATRRINDSVRDDTHGLIPTLFDQPLSPDIRVVLTDALYLDATWTTPFTETVDAPFHTADGDVTVPLMLGGEGAIAEADGWQRAELDYVDGTMAAIVVLPPDGVDPCAVSADVLAGLEQAEDVPGDVAMPRLHREQTHQLLATLTDMGLPADGDWSGLGEDLVVSQVVLKVLLDVDEEGTTAAAAAGAGMAGSAPGERPSLVVDRPYLLVLTDTATRSPLFVAVIQDASA